MENEVQTGHHLVWECSEWEEKRPRGVTSMGRYHRKAVDISDLHAWGEQPRRAAI